MQPVTHRRILPLILLFLLVSAGSAQAYLLSSSQITRQMVKKLGKPVTATLQLKELFFRSAITDEAEGENLVFDERVTLAAPDRFHSVVMAGEKRVEQLSTFDTWFRVVDGQLDKGQERAADRYRDPLQFRQKRLITQRLADAGVDLSVTSLDRYAGRIAWVMGAKPSDPEGRPQFWVDKESFLPMRWILFEKGSHQRVEIWYHDWFKKGNAFYPERIEFYAEGRLFREIRVKRVSAGKPLDLKRFNPAAYAPKKPATPDKASVPPELTEKERQMNEIERILSNDPLAF
ncbi:hypothetical protein [Desulfoluna sp.]|uniref:hypothetical protein n=1 Tax=Desulfoluna sp. TaxID=2045199 RepID=UPI00261C8916|nr:hypothetical protein [Desulfoluna sp.]